MSARGSRAKAICAAVLVSVVATAAVTTAVLTSRKPTPVVEKQSVVYVPMILPGTPVEPAGQTQLTNAELPRASANETAESPEATEEPAATPPGRSLGEVLDNLKAQYDAVNTVAVVPVQTAAPMSTQPPPAVTEEPPPVMSMPQQPQQPEAPQVGAGSFMTAAPPYAASNWQSDPNAGAGQFSTDKGSIDPNIGAGPFTTEWHIPVVVY